MTQDIAEKIQKHLDAADDIEQKKSSQDFINQLAEKYNTSPEMVEKAIAEWSSGSEKVDS